LDVEDEGLFEFDILPNEEIGGDGIGNVDIDDILN